MISKFIFLAECSPTQQNPNFDKNVELAKKWFETFTSENFEGVSDFMADDVEWRSCFYGAPLDG